MDTTPASGWRAHGVGHEEGLLERVPCFRRRIDRRNPYFDPLSFVQIELLRRLCDAGGDDDLLGRVSLPTINGIAGGLRNTG